MKKLPVKHPTVSARLGRFIFHAAAARGVPAPQLIQATGFDPSICDDPDARIPLALEMRLWDTAAELGKDADFGLHAAEAIRPGAFDVLDYAVRTAPNLGEALKRIVRYNRLVHDIAEFRVVEHMDTVCIEHRFSAVGIRPCRHASEFTLASLLVIGGQMTGVALHPLAVAFAHAQPEQTNEHRRLFGLPPQFGAAVSSLTLPRTILDQPVSGADAGLSRIVTAHAEQLLAACATPDIVGSVHSLLAANMSNGPMKLSEVAQQLHLGERSLQRRLESGGTSFIRLVDEVRKELALRYIDDQHLALGEIAYLLGFAEPSPFHRAFKRWTGITPAAARRVSAKLGER